MSPDPKKTVTAPPLPASQAAAQPRRYKRYARNIFIHKPMQREFSFVLIALLMVSTVAVGFVIHHTIREIAFSGAAHTGKVNSYSLLSTISEQLVLRVSCVLLVTLVVIGFFGVSFLHRVAGPVYRFRQTFLRLNDDEIPPPIKLREGDFFSETAVEINHFMDKLKVDREKMKQVKGKLDAAISSGSAASLQETLKEVRSLLG